jgi:hypothetical protein
MASINSSLSTLRAIAQRLASTPTWQLPHIVGHLASSLTTCKAVFANSNLRHIKNDGSEAAFLVHKFKTRLSALLQDNSPEARWSAIILIKATVETGGWDVYHECGAWVRGLLGILSKPDPPTTKELCIIALTRIFLLLEDHQSLVREITTPSLPGFIASCLNLVKSEHACRGTKKMFCYDSILTSVLQSFGKLLPRHPTLFRPFLSQIRSLILPLTASTPSNVMLDEDPKLKPITSGTYLAYSSRRLLVLLSSCAPKNTSAEEWAESVHVVIKSLHRTADRAFRAVIEDWEPSTSRAFQGGNQAHDFAEIVSDLDGDELGLPAWRGIHAGVERIDGLLHIIHMFVATPTKLSVRIPLGALVDVAERILSIFPPRGEHENEYRGPRVNPEAGKEERDGLWMGLPMVHVSALEVLSLIVSRLGQSSAIASHVILERSLWVFEAEHSDIHVRTIVYNLVSHILKLLGLSLPKTIAPPLSNCVRVCCEDLVPSKDQPARAKGPTTSVQKQTGDSVSINADCYLIPQIRSTNRSENLLEIETAATSLLAAAISQVPKDFFSYSLRAQIDRTAVLMKSKPMMVASVLNPPTRRKGAREMSSLMPLLAREFPCSPEVEALVRPRMPLLQTRKVDIGESISYVDADESTKGQSLEHYERTRGDRETQFVNVETHEQSSIGYTERPAERRSMTPQLPETHAPSTAQKRDREPSPSPQIPSQVQDREILSGDPSSEPERPTKQGRFEAEYSDKQTPSSTSGAGSKPPIGHQPPQADTSSKATPVVISWNSPDMQRPEGIASSDESDFEMPVIDPESDTDMEEDEEDNENE